MIAIGKKSILLLVFVEGLNLVDDVHVEGKNFPFGFSELRHSCGEDSVRIMLLYCRFFELILQLYAAVALDKRRWDEFFIILLYCRWGRLRIGNDSSIRRHSC
jgi:hypothetical protein